MNRILVTGAAGFIGSNFCRYMLSSQPGLQVDAVDCLTYAGNMSTIADLTAQEDRFQFHIGRIEDRAFLDKLFSAASYDAVVNFAAETHNDRSMVDAGAFIQTDVVGVHILLSAARDARVPKIVHISTDEVYGSTDTGDFNEDSPIAPNTPYAASKAGGDLQARAQFMAYGTPVIVTRCTNNYGPYQYPEKLMPYFISRLIDGRTVPLYGSGLERRDWIHVHDHCTAIEVVLNKGVPGLVYNIGASCEQTNLEVTERIAAAVGAPLTLIKRVPNPRGNAHDKRYSVDATRLRSLGWTPVKAFAEGIESTVEWYRANEPWWRPIIASPAYCDFTERLYGPLLGDDF